MDIKKFDPVQHSPAVEKIIKLGRLLIEIEKGITQFINMNPLDPSQFAGMSWDVYAKHVEEYQNKKEQFVKIDTGVNKLPIEDRKIYGLIVNAEPLNLIVCEICGMVVKALALAYHYDRRHSGNSCKDSSPEMIETGDSSFESSLVTSFSNNLFVKDNYCDSVSNVDVEDKNIEEKNKLASVSTASRRVKVPNENLKKRNKRALVSLKTLKLVKKLENRSPLSQMCANSKRKDVRVKSKLKEPTLLDYMDQSKKIKTAHSSDDIKDGEDYLLHQLPELSLEEQKKSDDDPTNSISFLSRAPKPLSEPPLFSCHKAGGLLYSRKHMKMTRKFLQQSLNGEMRNTNLLQQIKARRKDPITRKKK